MRISDWSSDLCSSDLRRNPGVTYDASLDRQGGLEVSTRAPSHVAQLIDVLHQQVGLPFDHQIAMPIMGGIALLYAVAIVSGVICLLPSLVKDLFALRFGKNLKRMWLDLHNVLGLFSLPRSEEHTSELQSLMRISYAVFCLKKKN